MSIMRTLILLLLFTALAQGQFVPFAFVKSASVTYAPPTDSCKLRWKASSIVGKSSGDTVGIMPTIIPGGSRNVYQTTGANKPVYYADSINGKPAVRFDGADDWVHYDNAAVLTDKMTIIVICRTAAPIKPQVLCEYTNNWNTSPPGVLWAINNTETQDSSLVEGGSTSDGPLYNLITSTVVCGLNTLYVIGDVDRSKTNYNESQITVNGIGSYYYGNPSLVRELSGAFTTNNINFGSRYNNGWGAFNGVVAEVIVYSTSYRAWSMADKNALTNYLLSEYGL